jgi:antirestriction protein ArdC
MKGVWRVASQNKQEKMKALTDKLEQGVKDVYESDKYKNYLGVMSKFHFYSFRNSLLIMLQKPEATHVAGFNAWKTTFKRSVNKGEKGLQILAPAPYRFKVEIDCVDPITRRPVLDNSGKPVTEEVEMTKPAFRAVYVFDVSQTSGEPLPQLTTELTGSVAQYNAFFESLKSVSPFPMQFEEIQGAAKGYCDPVNKIIAIKTGMSELQNIKTAIHEITHADLHAGLGNLSLDERKDRRTKEVEAESVAFVVCSHFCIDTSDYSFTYVASWSSDKELNVLKSSLDTIQKHAAELIDRIDTRFQELLKEQPILTMPNEPLTIAEHAKNSYEAPAERTFSIYQLKDGEDNHLRRWESYERLEKQGEQPDIKNYAEVYAGKMEQSATLENIYQEFNINKPADFTGHSLTMSDIVVVVANGVHTANYVDTFGYVSCPDFARQHEQGINKDDVVHYGRIDFLGAKGIIGETIYYTDKKSFDQEVLESNDVGRPISYQVYNSQHGFKDSVKPLTMAERMAAAKERSSAQKQNRDPEKDQRHNKEKEER